MFGIDVMTGAMFFALVNLATFVIVLFIFYRIARKIYVFVNDDSHEKKMNIKKEVFGLGFLILFFTFFGSLTQPKVSIDTPPNREVIEYQENKEEVIINTPAPRTQELDGFESLKKD